MRWQQGVESYAPFVGAAIGGAATRSLSGAQKGMQAGSTLGKIAAATDKQQTQTAKSIEEARAQDKARMALQYGLSAGSDSED